MPEQPNYGMQIGRLIVANALSRPCADVEWPVLPSLQSGAWMTAAVERAVLEALANSASSDVGNANGGAR